MAGEEQMNHIIWTMTDARYILPLTREGKKRGIKSKVFICNTSDHNKYNNPQRHMNVLKELASKYDFEIHSVNDLHFYPDNTFIVEGQGCQYAKGSKIFSLSYMTDFTLLYNQYINDVDHVILPSKYLAEFYNTVSDKNLYLGSPKYDYLPTKKEIFKKYSLPKKPIVSILYPRFRDFEKSKINDLIIDIVNHKYNSAFNGQTPHIIIKGRGKEPICKNLKQIPNSDTNINCYEDGDWYPHNSLELIKASDLVINYDSTAIKECILLKTPVLNFNIKPFKQVLPFLYEKPCAYNVNPNILDNPNRMKEIINKLINQATEENFDKLIEKYLFNYNSSAAILNYIENV